MIDALVVYVVAEYALGAGLGVRVTVFVPPLVVIVSVVFWVPPILKLLEELEEVWLL